MDLDKFFLLLLVSKVTQRADVVVEILKIEEFINLTTITYYYIGRVAVES
jgi:hypothetical protein